MLKTNKTKNFHYFLKKKSSAYPISLHGIPATFIDLEYPIFNNLPYKVILVPPEIGPLPG